MSSVHANCRFFMSSNFAKNVQNIIAPVLCWYNDLAKFEIVYVKIFTIHYVVYIMRDVDHSIN